MLTYKTFWGILLLCSKNERGRFMDKEYIILSEIQKDEHITQRELSEKAGVSLGSINLLLKKMIREGLIKMKAIPANRVGYMLTPKGASEKLSKTYHYVKYHLNYINEMKSKIKKIILDTAQENDHIQVLAQEDELGELVKVSLHEINRDYFLKKIDQIQKENLLIVADDNAYNNFRQQGYNVINLLEKL